MGQDIWKQLLLYFTPHPHTHRKAKLLHWHFLLIYILLFSLLRVGLDLVSIYQPGVLGVASNITIEKVIEETNKERVKRGLPLLYRSELLSNAAKLKAQNMFEENYWAHFSPSGKDPWGFIKAAGYRFSFAGENLARNFYTSEDVVAAWMNSPSHRDNLLSPNYEDIGIAVVDGVLKGQNTTLVVQMFGKNYEQLALKPEVNGGISKTVSESVPLENKPVWIAGSSIQNSIFPNKSFIDPFMVTRVVGISLILFISLLLIADFIILKRRGVFRFSSYHFAHLSLLALTGSQLLSSKVGEIL